MKGLALVFLFAVAFIGCSKEMGKPKGRFSSKPISASDKDILIPKSLTAIIEKNYVKKYKELEPTSPLTSRQIVAQIPRRFLSLDIYFKQKSGGPLESKSHFHVPRGGGVIDLRDHVLGTTGSFFVQILAGLESNELEELKVYFVGNSKPRYVDGEKFGTGCGKFVDLTKFYHKTIVHEGLRVNATGKRYLSTLAGTFFFTLPTKEGLYLSSLTFLDSRFKDLHCSI